MTERQPGAEQFLAGRHLVFGVIALQNGFVTREQLLAAFDAWVRDKTRGLAEVFLAQGALTADHHEVLQRLVALFLEKHRGDVEQSLAALSPVADLQPTLRPLDDPSLAASLGLVGRDRRPGDDLAPTLIPTDQGSRGRFRILRPHARGGLGQVSVALDQELNREVALKEIQPQHADDLASRERFVIEAEITGGLEHPGIVPVYALGQSPDGRPFYAMRFIRGDSLKTAIEAFHGVENPNRGDPGGRPLELRRLLGRFIDVCNAIDYAHSRGVLHRDLKPGNIMVGKYGETLVVDWGLAKAVGRPDVDTEEMSLRPSSSLSSSGQTQPGSAIGTPAYMSPEQALGQLDRLGPASDVYGLGATLYHLLCGRAPFDKEQIGEILTKVQRGDFPRPRNVVADVPAALEAVCLKAMSLKPADRYATPRALADDLEHWLADEPVTAHAESASARVARWSRKHRGLVQAGSAAVVLLLVVITASALLVNEQRKRTVELARERGELADTNEGLLKAERAAMSKAREKQALADQRNASLKQALAKNLFDHGIGEYEAGRVQSACSDLARALVMTTEDDPLGASYRRVLADRVCQGGMQLTPPLRCKAALEVVALSPDGLRIATGNREGLVRLWDATTGRTIGESMSHELTIRAIAFSPDGAKLLTGSDDRTARLWNAFNGRPLGKPLRHDDWVTSVDFSPDGRRLVTGSEDQTARLWNAETGQPLGAVMPHSDWVTGVQFSPDGTRVLTGSDDKTARLWDSGTGQSVGAPMLHEQELRSMAYSPDGTRIVTASDYNLVRLWDATSGAPVGQPLEHTENVFGVSFSPDGTRLLTASVDDLARVWDAASGRLLGDPFRHPGSLRSATFSPDGARVLTAGGMVAMTWDAASGDPVEAIEEEGSWVQQAVFSPDGTRILTLSEDAVRLWDATIGSHRELVDKTLWDSTHVAFSADGSRVVQTDGERTAKLSDLVSGQVIGVPMSHKTRIDGIAISRDGTRVVTWGDLEHGGGVFLWEGSGRPLGHLDWSGAADLVRVTLSSDGALVATSRRSGNVNLWDGNNGKSLGEAPRHQKTVSALAFSPDGTILATGSHDSTARLWDGTTGRPRGAPLQHGDPQLGEPIDVLAFSPDGSRLLTTCGKTACLWDTDTGRRLTAGMPLDGYGRAAAFRADGARCVTANLNGTARLWNGRTGEAIGERLRHLGGGIDSVAFSRDGTLVATTGGSAVLLWDAETGRSLASPFEHDSDIKGSVFSRDGLRMLTWSLAGGEFPSVRAWDATLPRVQDMPAARLLHALERWTGSRCDPEGNLVPLSKAEWETADATGENDVVGQFQAAQLSRRSLDHHLRAASMAERNGRWFAASFHLKELLKRDPDNTLLAGRLAEATRQWEAAVKSRSQPAANP